MTQKVSCDECGHYVTRANMTRHKQSKKHQRLIEEQRNPKNSFRFIKELRQEIEELKQQLTPNQVIEPTPVKYRVITLFGKEIRVPCN
jgi:hypothetical protein